MSKASKEQIIDLIKILLIEEAFKTTIKPGLISQGHSLEKLDQIIEKSFPSFMEDSFLEKHLDALGDDYTTEDLQEIRDFYESDVLSKTYKINAFETFQNVMQKMQKEIDMQVEKVTQ